MARIDTLDNFLTDVADAIRAKTESAGLIPASDFDTEIESIPGAEKYFVSASTSQLNKPYMWIKELPNLDLSTLTSMLDMFYDCTALEKVGTLNIPNVTDIRECFYKCSALTEVSFSNMNINNIRVTDLFKSCSSLTKISGLNLSGASSLLELFANCESLTSSELFNETNTFTTTATVPVGEKFTKFYVKYSLSGTTNNTFTMLTPYYEVKSGTGSTNVAFEIRQYNQTNPVGWN